ncbi:MAG: hypothetical protein COA42_18765 [Alteromonadaceae bacterium]|nr:MAG: hypothetical protein COA42_18765 [Alteromonadaceae bacterium]
MYQESIISRPQALEPMALDLDLPWTDDQAAEERLKKNMQRTLIAVIAIFVVMNLLPLFEGDIEKSDIIYTQVMLEPKVQEKPPEPISTPKPKRKKHKKKTPKIKNNLAKATPEMQEKSELESLGLEGLFSQLSSLTNAVDMGKVHNKNVNHSNKGKVAEKSDTLLGENQLTRRSGKVNIDEGLMHTDSTKLSSRKTTSVAGVDLGGELVDYADNYSELRAGRRDMESIRRALEAVKSRVYMIYQQELTVDPNLSGKLTFNLTIAPDGRVSQLSLVDSELGIQTLEETILGQIQRIHFGEDDVISTSVNYTFNFLPG